MAVALCLCMARQPNTAQGHRRRKPSAGQTTDKALISYAPPPAAAPLEASFRSFSLYLRLLTRSAESVTHGVTSTPRPPLDGSIVSSQIHATHMLATMATRRSVSTPRRRRPSLQRRPTPAHSIVLTCRCRCCCCCCGCRCCGCCCRLVGLGLRRSSARLRPNELRQTKQ